MRAASCLLSTTSLKQTVGIARRITPFHRFQRRLPCEKIRQKSTGKELDRETGLYYFGARYLDPRTSRWLSPDPAIWEGDFLPSAPINDEARERNQNLPGMGGVFNTLNLHAFGYSHNNPVRFVDPDGRLPMEGMEMSSAYVRGSSTPAAQPTFGIQQSITDSAGIGAAGTAALGLAVEIFSEIAPNKSAILGRFGLSISIPAFLMDVARAVDNPNLDTISDAVISGIGVIPGKGTLISSGLTVAKVGVEGLVMAADSVAIWNETAMRNPMQILERRFDFMQRNR
ncbi:MAG: RHS repeat-associated core domain-containing protein [Defluviitaleaceae bacterium]|nr:RHS repeat-associated core domain-containing protein [Defluviitaleaceae bacterium]